jgi:hypothetical protein
MMVMPALMTSVILLSWEERVTVPQNLFLTAMTMMHALMTLATQPLAASLPLLSFQ